MKLPGARPGLAAIATTALALAMIQAQAAAPVPRVVEVPFRPAFVRAPGGKEMPARAGQILAPASLIRTAKPGRLQVQLANGRQFRLGGDAVLRLGADGLNLERGQIIAWVNPGQKGGTPLRIRTRMATASIVGTTVFLDASDDGLKVFSWEGRVRVETTTGRRYDLSSGQQLTVRTAASATGAPSTPTWEPPRRLSQSEAAQRREKSLLLNGFTTPMETLPLIEKELGLGRPAGTGTPAAAAP